MIQNPRSIQKIMKYCQILFQDYPENNLFKLSLKPHFPQDNHHQLSGVKIKRYSLLVSRLEMTRKSMTLDEKSNTTCVEDPCMSEIVFLSPQLALGIPPANNMVLSCHSTLVMALQGKGPNGVEVSSVVIASLFGILQILWLPSACELMNLSPASFQLILSRSMELGNVCCTLHDS